MRYFFRPTNTEGEWVEITRTEAEAKVINTYGWESSILSQLEAHATSCSINPTDDYPAGQLKVEN